MNKIAEFRKLKSLSQAELGRSFDPPLRQSAVSNHEVGVRTPDVYQALHYARVLDVSVERLFPSISGNSNVSAA
ncbi:MULTISPECIES: helix-turn-helix transcriptional regulator [unclassified Neptuniibacter]|uniref:helix-turn-helix transcriptional regulator n=1 Tax=unclassified Neptuniibacter TaxID=2630693 RepID=UPI0039C935F2|tara:strand:- start:27275 stop:27496 length:222 start_codon:yes stop_codon:yes gene_type:complete